MAGYHPIFNMEKSCSQDLVREQLWREWCYKKGKFLANRLWRTNTSGSFAERPDRGGTRGGRRLAASGNGHNIKIKYFSIIVTFSEGFHTTKWKYKVLYAFSGRKRGVLRKHIQNVIFCSFEVHFCILKWPWV